MPSTPPPGGAGHPGLEEEAMIVEAPLMAAQWFDDIANQVKAFIQSAVRASADGITWAEFGELFVALMRLAIRTLDGMDSLTGADKKEIVIHAVGVLFDQVAHKAVPAVLWPLWLVSRGAIRSLILALAGGAVEILLPMVRSLP
jgi:hypothetical protein